MQSIFTLWNRDIPIGLSIILVVGLLASIIFHKKIASHKTPIIIAVSLWCVPIVLIQRVVPFERVWLFLLPIYIILSSSGIIYIIMLIITKIKKSKKYHYIFIPIISLALAISVSLIVFNSQSVYHSNSTGTFREAKETAMMFKGELKSGDKIMAGPHTDTTLMYHFEKNGIPINYIYSDYWFYSYLNEDSDLYSSSRIFIVVNEYFKPTLNETFKSHNLSENGYSNPELFKKDKYDYIYITYKIKK